LLGILDIHHAKIYGLYKKKRKINSCPKAWEEKRGKRKGKKDSTYLKKEINGRVVRKGLRIPSQKNSIDMHILISMYDLFLTLH
jgi:hypothetical protein